MATHHKQRADQAHRGTKKPPQPKPGQRTESVPQAEPPIFQHLLAEPSLASPSDILALQRTAGNRAVTSLIQTKLRVGPVGDAYEQEADRVADQVMRMPDPSGQPALQRQEEEEELIQMAPLLQRQEEEEELIQLVPLVQRAAAGAGFEVGGAIERRLNSRQGAGAPLPDDVRANMEGRFGADFGPVRIHRDSEAGQLAHALQAKAFTHGSDIYFSPGQYDPGTSPGQRLLAHELTHVIQQSGDGGRIQRWGSVGGGTSHVVVTDEAFQGVTGYSEQAQEYLAEASEMMDLRAGFFLGFAAGKAWQKIRSRMGTNPKHYDELVGYWRPESEAPNHAEAGRYKTDGATEDIAHVNSLVDRAKNAWDKNNRTQALSMLGLALHSAEDRGAHGDGRPGEGHDPRRTIKPPFGATKNYYEEGWEGTDCDKRSKNPAGYARAVLFAREVLTQFRDYVAESDDPAKLAQYHKGEKTMKVIEGWEKAKNFFGLGWADRERPAPAWSRLDNWARAILMKQEFAPEDVDRLSEGLQARLIRWQQAGDKDAPVPDTVLSALNQIKEERERREKKEGDRGPAWDRLTERVRGALFYTGFTSEDVAQLPSGLQEKLVTWTPSGGPEEYIPDEIMRPLKEIKARREAGGGSTLHLTTATISELSPEERVARINSIMRLSDEERMALINYLEANAETITPEERAGIIRKFLAGPKVKEYLKDHVDSLTAEERDAAAQAGIIPELGAEYTAGLAKREDLLASEKQWLTRKDWEARAEAIAADPEARKRELAKGKLQWWIDKEEEKSEEEETETKGEGKTPPESSVSEPEKEPTEKSEEVVEPSLAPEQLTAIFLRLSGMHYEWLEPANKGAENAINVEGHWFVKRPNDGHGDCQYYAMAAGLAFLEKGELTPPQLRQVAAAQIGDVPQLRESARAQIYDLLVLGEHAEGIAPAFKKRLLSELARAEKTPESHELKSREHMYSQWKRLYGFNEAEKRLKELQARLDQLKKEGAKDQEQIAKLEKELELAKEERERLMETKAYKRHQETLKKARGDWEDVLLNQIADSLVPDYIEAVEKESSMWGDQTTLEALKRAYQVEVHVHGSGG